MAPSFKEEIKEGPSKDLQQRAEKKKHNFQFRFLSETKPVSVVCDTSMTVLDALNTSQTFRINKNVRNTNKEIVIQRSDGAAVKTDFPCCLLKKGEILTITFIKGKGATSTEQQKHKDFSLPRTDIVAFKIKTTGGEKVKYIMKSKELRKKADYVCVYAFKDEEIETALVRDGRLIDKIFQKHCVLSLEFKCKEKKGQQSMYEMSSPVDKHLDKKTFQIIAIGARRPDNQTKQTKVETESDGASNTESGKNDPDLHPISSKQKQTTLNTESTSLLTKWTIIPDSENLLQILHGQCKDLMDKLKQQKNLIKNFPLQKFLRAEYDKSVQSFFEVYKIKQLMRLSDSVCQIRVDGSPRGTGFLLFGQFILTNAHVIMECVESPDRLLSTRNLVAVFDYDSLVSNVTMVPVKRQIAAYCCVTNQFNHLDFALLELDAVDIFIDRPELLSCYGSPPNCGEICIVGHPDGGIKRTDYGFIIGTENLLQADIRHVSDNVNFIHVITQRSLEDRWDFHENQINYNSCFFHGSSGSPVFDKHCKLIGVHSGGYVYPGESRTSNIIEYAYPMQPILDMIRAQARIRGMTDIVNILDLYRLNVPEAAEQQNQEDCEMEDV